MPRRLQTSATWSARYALQSRVGSDVPIDGFKRQAPKYEGGNYGRGVPSEFATAGKGRYDGDLLHIRCMARVVEGCWESIGQERNKGPSMPPARPFLRPPAVSAEGIDTEFKSARGGMPGTVLGVPIRHGQHPGRHHRAGRLAKSLPAVGVGGRADAAPAAHGAMRTS